MQQGLTTQQVRASILDSDKGQAFVTPEGTDEWDTPEAGNLLRLNLRQRLVILDEIHEAAKAGNETEVLRLGVKLACLVKKATHIAHLPKAA